MVTPGFVCQAGWALWRSILAQLQPLPLGDPRPEDRRGREGVCPPNPGTPLHHMACTAG